MSETAPAASPSAVPLIRCRGLERAYGTASARTVALAGVDLDVVKGERIAMVGPSGSGKSTLLHLIGAMDAPDKGGVVVAGRDLARFDDAAAARFRREEIGFVFQFFNLVPTLSSLDNVALPARLAGKGASEAQAAAQKLLDRVGLGNRAADFPDALSGGQQQRVAVARALVNEPQIVLADEPTGALDRRTGEEILALLGEVVRERGATLLMATHSDAAVSIATRLLSVEDGRITEDRALTPITAPIKEHA
ncbi:MAG: ABC transporter ATP-binding protein [Planctomycetes bacterium]|nr:ABC transporter ATP-binding protein [Planctomycetota bacterium]